MWNRLDGFRALKAGDNMPGKLEWSVGYYAKTKMQQCQFDQQTHDPTIRTMEQLKDVVNKSSERKLREIMCKEAKPSGTRRSWSSSRRRSSKASRTP